MDNSSRAKGKHGQFASGAASDMHVRGATPEQRAKLRQLCDLMEWHLEDSAPPGIRKTEAPLVGFSVEPGEVEDPSGQEMDWYGLAISLGLSRAALSRMAWRIGSAMMLFHYEEMQRGE